MEFAALVPTEHDAVPLWACAMALSRVVQDGLTWSGSEEELDRLVAKTRDGLADVRGDRARAQVVLATLRDEGYRGELEHYEDIRNSMIDRVLERRRGLPITLSLLAMEIADRAGVTLHGIGFPGHFLVGVELDEDEPAVFDPFFEGQTVTLQALADRYGRATDTETPPDAAQIRAHLRPAASRQILSRILGNLQRHYLLRGVHDRAAQVAELLAIVHPEVDDYKRVQGELEDRLRRLN